MSREYYFSGESGTIERAAGIVRNGGIVAGLVGLLVSEPLLVAGIFTAAGGELIRRSQKKSQ